MKTPDLLSLSFRRSLHKHRLVPVINNTDGHPRICLCNPFTQQDQVQTQNFWLASCSPCAAICPSVGGQWEPSLEMLVSSRASSIGPGRRGSLSAACPSSQSITIPLLSRWCACGHLSLPFQGPYWLVTMRLAVLLPIHTDGATRGRGVWTWDWEGGRLEFTPFLCFLCYFARTKYWNHRKEYLGAYTPPHAFEVPQLWQH